MTLRMLQLKREKHRDRDSGRQRMAPASEKSKKKNIMKIKGESAIESERSGPFRKRKGGYGGRG